MYKLDLNANIDLTTLSGELKSTFPQMIQKFGEGYKGGYKTSMEWSFIDDNDNTFTVYDWKSTNLYADEHPSPEVLWDSNELYNFHVGSRGCADDFIDWISIALGGNKEELENDDIDFTEEPQTIYVYVFELRDAFDTIMKKYDASPAAMLIALKQVAKDETDFQQDIHGGNDESTL